MELKLPLDDMINHFVEQKTITLSEAKSMLKETMKDTGYLPKFKDKELAKKMNPYRN